MSEETVMPPPSDGSMDAVQLRAELAELQQLNDRMQSLLTRTAEALKGTPQPLHMHSWHDLPALAAAAVGDRNCLLAKATGIEGLALEFDSAAESEHRSSPALKERSKHYPKEFGDGVPRLVQVNRRVRSDVPFLDRVPMVARPRQVYLAWTNSHGAVSAILPGGRLGLMPHEFEVVTWAT